MSCLKGSADEALHLLEWAEQHPQHAMGAIDSWWVNSGPGSRDAFFNFRECIREAMENHGARCASPDLD